MNKLTDAHNTSNAQMIREMNQVRQELKEIKETLGRLNTRSSVAGQRRSILFGRRRRQQQIEPEKQKPALPLEDLLPLLPHLSGALPQLKSPKVAESLKVLSNPAVLSMIQQFLANGGMNLFKGKQITQVSRRERHGLFR